MADFTGTTGADTFTDAPGDNSNINDGGGAGFDSLDAGNGADTITVTGGIDTVAGGAGSDRLVVTYANNIAVAFTGSFAGTLAAGYSGVFNGTGSNDVNFTGVEHFSITTLGTAASSITTGDGNDSLTGGGGADILVSGSGIDTIDGGAGNDTWGGDRSAETGDLIIDLSGLSTLLGTGSVVNVEGFNTLIAGSGDDQITSTGLAVFSETIDAGAGNDIVTLFGQGIDDVIGGLGDDRLVITSPAAVSAVTVTSFAGSLATGYSGNYDGSGSNDVGFAGVEHFTYTHLGAGVANITTGDGDDDLSGGAAADILKSGGGVDVIDGGGGNDSWGGDKSLATQNIVIDLNGVSTYLGTGSVVNVEGFNTLITGSGNDQLTSTGTAVFSETIDAGAGNDIITLFGQGIDDVIGGTGNDRLVITSPAAVSAVTVTGFAGSLATGYSGNFDGSASNDVGFAGIESFTYTHLGAGVANITTGDGDDDLTGGAAADILKSGGGVDVIDGGAGIDSWGGDKSFATQDIVVDLNGASTYLGTGSVVNVEGFNTLITGSGDDQITSTTQGTFSEVVDAGGGDDVVTLFGLGIDDVAGGTGNDRLVVTFSSAVSAVTLSGFAGSLAAGYSGTFDGSASNDAGFTGIESFNITHQGAGAFNALTGDGADALTGGSGGDSLRGAGGADTIEGGAGDDTLNGGDGVDVASYAGASAAVTVALIAGAQVTGGAGTDTLSFFENLTGSAFDDRLTGDAATNAVNGGGGDDTVLGGDGDDLLDGGADEDTANYVTAGAAVTVALVGGAQNTGGAGTDTLSGFENLTGSNFGDTLTGDGGANDLRGGKGRDFLVGNAGADDLFGDAKVDTLNGGLGRDDLFGGGGGDRFVFSDIADSTVAVSGRDRIRDFVSADGDVIDLRPIDANANTGANNAFTVVAAFTSVAGQLVLEFDGARTLVKGDVTGDGVADFAIEVQSPIALTAADFLL